MNQDEQIEFVENVGAMIIVSDTNHSDIKALKFTPEELAAYTAAVEAKERERCAVKYSDVARNWEREDIAQDILSRK